VRFLHLYPVAALTLRVSCPQKLLSHVSNSESPTAYKPELIATSYRDGGEALEVAFGPGDDGVAETGVAPAASSALYFGALT